MCIEVTVPGFAKQDAQVRKNWSKVRLVDVQRVPLPHRAINNRVSNAEFEKPKVFETGSAQRASTHVKTIANEPPTNATEISRVIASHSHHENTCLAIINHPLATELRSPFGETLTTRHGRGEKSGEESFEKIFCYRS